MFSTASPQAAAKASRTRNAQAQADLRARRKAYIKSLEDTVSSLETCVRQLRSQNADLLSSSHCSHSASMSSSQLSEQHLGAIEALRDENAKLRNLLAESALAAAAATRLAKIGKDPLGDAESGYDNASTSSTKQGARATQFKEEQTYWSSTSSITTKKRKLTKMQAFAKDIDSHLRSQAPHQSPLSTAVGFQSSINPIPQPNLENEISFAGLHDSCLPDHHHTTASAFVERITPASSSTSSSSRESVVSHRSPETPRFDAPSASIPYDPPKAAFFDPSHPLPFTFVERPWPSAHPSQVSLSYQPTYQQDSSFPQLPMQPQQSADLAMWLKSTLQPTMGSSASISDARSKTLHPSFPSPPHKCHCRIRIRQTRRSGGSKCFGFQVGTGNPSLTKSIFHPFVSVSPFRRLQMPSQGWIQEIPYLPTRNQ